ncbi:uncharacterized protein BP01DRAFT_112640 [Aspergillus saccharolyticus JOP 1030-1]|uniref:Uncharacterized protein n=1 Tax=Aspergillus saccharolyticus JOP 1030-1 TaxID=1450539 RepID=A0A319AQY1_9EURO|nr:hypothetical protein BP01DRAFT_112640 [Aspergillus saccharolyticus JOP 1030-1]PYH48792.1 hypothetical protein BP01DRAFT_112640 [Aspergillus saccharolyticus JOP 1030-1]
MPHTPEHFSYGSAPGKKTTDLRACFSVLLSLLSTFPFFTPTELTLPLFPTPDRLSRLLSRPYFTLPFISPSDSLFSPLPPSSRPSPISSPSLSVSVSFRPEGLVSLSHALLGNLLLFSLSTH